MKLTTSSQKQQKDGADAQFYFRLTPARKKSSATEMLD
jgi:hypothetical protein